MLSASGMHIDNHRSDGELFELMTRYFTAYEYKTVLINQTDEEIDIKRKRDLPFFSSTPTGLSCTAIYYLPP